MKTVFLYKYINDNELVITPEKRNQNDEPYKVRLIADEGKILTNNEISTSVIDTEISHNFIEIDDERQDDII